MTATRLLPVVLLAASSLAAPMQAQQAAGDARWQAWLGCWTTTQPDTAAPMTALCVIPAAGTSAVDFVQVADLRVVARSHVEADGTRHPVTRDDCTGWDRADWSPDGRRLFVRTERDCAGGPHRVTSAIMAMTAEGRWLTVQGVQESGPETARVLRYDVAPADLAMPEEVVTALSGDSAARRAARLAAYAPVDPAAVIAASAQLDTMVLETWLAVTAGPVRFNGRQLVQLADGGVSQGTIDLLVALAHPGVFAVAAEEQGRKHPSSTGTYGSWLMAPMGMGGTGLTDRPGYSTYRQCALYRGDWLPLSGNYLSGQYYSGEGGPAGAQCQRYGLLGFYGHRPVVQVVAGSGSNAPAPKGRAVNGRGYTQGGNPSGRPSAERPSGSTSSQGTGAGGDRQGSASPSGGYSGGSTTTTGGERTAKPRP